MKLELLPAVDVKAGQAVRLIQGELGSESNYGAPLDAALDFQRAGAEWIHLVDLDAAFDTGSNKQVIQEITSLPNIAIQLSGGIKDKASLDFAVSTNAIQINLSTSALHDLEWVSQVLS